MATLADLITELKTVVKAALSMPEPDAGKDNLLLSTQGPSRSFVSEVKSGSIQLDCVVISIGTFQPAPDYGVANDTAWAPVDIFLIAQKSTDGTQENIASRLQALRRTLRNPAAPFTTFAVVDPGSVRTNVDTPIVVDLMVDARVSVVAGMLQIQPGLLVDLADA